jgi:hypothetical protein
MNKIRVPDEVADLIRGMHPAIKKKVKASLKTRRNLQVCGVFGSVIFALFIKLSRKRFKSSQLDLEVKSTRRPTASSVSQDSYRTSKVLEKI